MQLQWRLNGQNLPDGTNADLFFSRLHGTNGGSYTFVASNSFGAITSSLASVAPMSVAGWASSAYGTTNPPLNLSNAVVISLSGDAAEALRSDGTVATRAYRVPMCRPLFPISWKLPIARPTSWG